LRLLPYPRTDCTPSAHPRAALLASQKLCSALRGCISATVLCLLASCQAGLNMSLLHSLFLSSLTKAEAFMCISSLTRPELSCASMFAHVLPMMWSGSAIERWVTSDLLFATLCCALLL
jgi:hypothetical protein